MKYVRYIWMLSVIFLYVIRHPKYTVRIISGYRDYCRTRGKFLDIDFYKITMGQLVWKYFRQVQVEYKLTMRKAVVFPAGFDDKLKQIIAHNLAHNMTISKTMAKWLKSWPFLDDEYIDEISVNLAGAINLDWITINLTPEGLLEISYHGPWWLVMFLETRLMSDISELYYEETDKKPVGGLAWVYSAWQKGRTLKLAGANYSEFGTRRRHSFFVQFVVLFALVVGSKKSSNKAGGLIGTSNVYLAYVFKLTPIGTMAHELFMVLGAIYGYENANKLVLAYWRLEYGNMLGYYLPDTYGSDDFLSILTRDDALYFTGPRQDSGNPNEFADKVVARYKSLGLSDKIIRLKSIIFSDALNVVKALALLKYAKELGIGSSFGIGTYFTNDVGHKPMNMVIKAVRAGINDRWQGCLKVSDDPGKLGGDAEAVRQYSHYLETGEKLWEPLLPLPEIFNAVA